METKPTVKLLGEDGNVFAIIGRVSRALKKAGLSEQAKAFTTKAFKCASYQEVLALVLDFVNPE